MDRTKLSPMMQHYLKTKDEYSDCVLFYRLGDFYEMFFDDAINVSRELELTLTGKDCGMEERAPMCGIPYHASDVYIKKLIDKGYKVAICEQVQDPKLAKGLVERKVIKIITPGTNIGDSDTAGNTYIMTISYMPPSGSGKNQKSEAFGIAVSDLSTGEFLTTSVNSFSKIHDEISKFQPKEIIIQNNPRLVNNNDFMLTYLDLEDKLSITKSNVPDSYFNFESSVKRIETQLNCIGVEGIGLKDLPECVTASGALITYMLETQMDNLMQINNIKLYYISDFMIIDSSTKRNLELTESMRDKEKKGTLLWVLDKTKTSMGARMLRSFIEMPLINIQSINLRLDGIESMNNSIMSRDEMREYMSSVYDLERLITKISMKSANPRDMLAFKTSLEYLPYIQNLLKDFDSDICRKMYQDFDTLQDLYQLLEASIDEDAPLTVKEGGIIKHGYNHVIDEFKDNKKNSKNILAEIEEREREKTGIKNLRIKFNKIYGYFFEVTNSYKDQVPDYFIRKQTLTNAERFVTDELTNVSNAILGADDKLFGLEYDEFVAIREKVAAEVVRVQKTAYFIALIDVLASLSYVAIKNNYVRPSLNSDSIIDIKEGRHPVVECVMKNNEFISNNTYLDGSTNRIMIITGPNMAGKSTYMRQTALICLMAQIGSFVPAESANICISDRIFTRVGASDDLAQGQSTFMVEMNEVSNILRNATKDSLIIMDEIGRGTSTFDGLSIAWAVVEYIADNNLLGAKTLFATHYHELTELEDKLSAVNNYSISIKQNKDTLVFLRKIVPGGADRSYGIEVAKLAGIPSKVIDRAREISDILADEDITGKARDIDVRKMSDKNENKKSKEFQGQLSMFATAEDMNIAAELRAMDLDNMTPVKAMLYLQELKERLK